MGVVAAIALLAAPSPGDAQEKDICAFTAHAAPSDPAGTDIRVAPTHDAEVLAFMPAHGRDEAFAPEFNVIGVSNGWLEIKTVAVGQYGTEPMKILFHGPGWIPATEARFFVEDPGVLDGPDGRPIWRLAGRGWEIADIGVTKIFGCRGGNVDAELHLPGGEHVRGWVRNLCGNQVSTCYP